MKCAKKFLVRFEKYLEILMMTLSFEYFCLRRTIFYMKWHIDKGLLYSLHALVHLGISKTLFDPKSCVCIFEHMFSGWAI